ncbi:hypothetical protein MUK42_31438 [Musa troglodytarum]|uniref:Uncharacterized protein n=1 Tax=Musa troglodytarum TaxID=320322 RepID=A0A9E7F9S4_9LILI|nr:hypothetical protein MUK42_31438 [Musa troglodytarum]
MRPFADLMWRPHHLTNFSGATRQGNMRERERESSVPGAGRSTLMV